MTQVLEELQKDKNLENINTFLYNLYNLPKYDIQKTFCDKEFENINNTEDTCYVITMLQCVIDMWSDIENNRKDKFFYLICKIIEYLVRDVEGGVNFKDCKQQGIDSKSDIVKGVNDNTTKQQEGCDYSVMSRQDIIFRLFLEIKELEIKNFILRVLIEKEVLSKEDRGLLVEYISKCKDISTLNIIRDRCFMVFEYDKEYYRGVLSRMAMTRGVSKRVRVVLFSMVDILKD